MIEYQVKYAQSLYSLERMVNAAIEDGWELAGDLQVIVITRKYGVFIGEKFYQPMTRVLPKDPTEKWERD